jgi:hypothetical protein
MFDAAAYVYPWDVVGDPAAPETLAGLGVDHITVAAFYHATRALTPRHPRHRIVTAGHTAAYLPLSDARWSGALLRPPQQTWIQGRDVFGDTATALASVGLPTHAWVVVDHVDNLALEPVVENAFGDHYRWALCPANPAVHDYAVRLAGETASRPDVSGIEFEAAGWYGFDHLHEHDKVAGVPLSEAEQFLFSLCFCGACQDEYRESGIDPVRLRRKIRETLDQTFRGDPSAAYIAEDVLAMRQRVADRLREAIVREVRVHRPHADFPVVFHGNPRPHRSTAFTGLKPSTLPIGTNGVVLNCWGDPYDAAESVALAVALARDDVRVLAGMLGVQGFGARPERIPAMLDAVRGAGASGIRIYHAGLASAEDLGAIRDLVTLAHTSHERLTVGD